MTAIREYLAERHPEAFGAGIKPLAAGIYERIVEQSPNIDAEELDSFLGGYTHSPDYLTAVMMADNIPRIGLNGRPSTAIQLRDKDMALVNLKKQLKTESQEMIKFRARQKQWVSGQLSKGMSSKQIRKMRPIRSALIAEVRAELDATSFSPSQMPQESQTVIGLFAKKNRDGTSKRPNTNFRSPSHSLRHKHEVNSATMTAPKKKPVIIIKKKSRSRAASLLEGKRAELHSQC
ncbi:MAG: hypothetical protein HRU20_16965 [Pseudomonadales bacterium]|nr:hypothetical protein [Pseudomonadales bacterium]